MTTRLSLIALFASLLAGCPAGEDTCYTYCVESQECTSGQAELTEEEFQEAVDTCYSAYEPQLNGAATRQVQLDSCQITLDALACDD